MTTTNISTISDLQQEEQLVELETLFHMYLYIEQFSDARAIARDIHFLSKDFYEAFVEAFVPPWNAGLTDEEIGWRTSDTCEGGWSNPLNASY